LVYTLERLGVHFRATWCTLYSGLMYTLQRLDVHFTATLISVHFDLADTVWDKQGNSKWRSGGLCICK